MCCGWLRWRAWAVTLLVPLVGMGCATPVPLAPDTLSGRLALVVAATPEQPARQFNAQFLLAGNAQQGRLELSSALGWTLATAQWEPGRVVLTTPQEQVVVSDLPTLAERTLGERLPLAAVFEWLRGRAWTQAPHLITQGNPEHPVTFEQLGWAVDLRRFAQGALTAKREGTPGITLQARWEVTP